MNHLQHQRRLRTGAGLALLGVAVLAGGIALGRSLPGPDGGPVGRTAGQTASTPSCPDAATLLALLPPPADGAPTPGLASPETVCAGEWAVIGVAPQAVELFRHVDGSWERADAADSCAAGRLPAEIEQSVCDAG